MGKAESEVVLCLLMIAFVFLFCLLLRREYLHRVPMVAGYVPGLVFKCFLYVSFHLADTP